VGGSLMGGTLTIRHGWFVVIVSTALFGVRGTRRQGRVVPGTLLGPEGTAVMVCLRNAGPSELRL
jgi:hypothetical protein